MVSNNIKEKGADYDRKIVSAETAARIDREGEDFKSTPDSEESLDTTQGYTVDREGLLNNYANEPEMYINEPGDLREEQESEEARKAARKTEINQPGGRGPGVI